VLTLLMGGEYMTEGTKCARDEPASCTDFVSSPAEVLLEKRDEKYVATIRDPQLASMLTEYRTYKSFTYEKCSGKTGTFFRHGASPVVNELCRTMDCGWRNCIRKTYGCDRSTGAAVEPPTVECVAPIEVSNIGTGKFVAFLFSLAFSILLCITGCIVGDPANSKHSGVLA